MIYNLAGVLGVDPGPLTLRELLWMAEGRGKSVWIHTSSLLAAIWSGNPNMKKPRLFKPREFNPYERARKGLRLTGETMQLFKGILLAKKGDD